MNPHYSALQGCHGTGVQGVILYCGSKTCVSSIQQEAQECSTFLGKQLEGELAASTDSAGLDRTDGSTKKIIKNNKKIIKNLGK